MSVAPPAPGPSQGPSREPPTPPPPPPPPAAQSPATFDALIAASGLTRLEARMLAEVVSGRRREWLIAHGDEPVNEDIAQRFRALAGRRARGEPLAYLTGVREFYGRLFRVTGAVLIPRPETELLVQWALAQAPEGARVLELGTGSGVIAVTMALERPDLRITATDVSKEALAVARDNALALGASVEFLAGDWYDALSTNPDGSAGLRPPADAPAFELIVTNPPYIAAADPHLSRGDLSFEPPGALTDGADGLEAIRIIIGEAPRWLAAGGWLAFEHGWDQGPAARELLEAAGFGQVCTLADGEGRDRVSAGSCPQPGRPAPFRLE